MALCNIRKKTRHLQAICEKYCFIRFTSSLLYSAILIKHFEIFGKVYFDTPSFYFFMNAILTQIGCLSCNPHPNGEYHPTCKR